MEEAKLSTLVSVRKVQKYHSGDILKAVEEIYVAAGGPDPKGKKVLLKPNILADLAPERAVTTHPEVFRGFVYNIFYLVVLRSLQVILPPYMLPVLRQRSAVLVRFVKNWE